MDSQTAEIVATYRDLASHPSPSSARVVGDGSDGFLTIYSEWSQRDLERQENIKFSRSQVLRMDPELGPQVVSESPPTEISTEVWNKLSPSGTYRAVLRKVAATGGATSDKQILEVWTHNKKVSNIDLQALDKHGPIYNDDNHFGSFEWSHGEGHILYIAEKKLPKYASFFDQKYGKVAEEGVDADETDAPLLGEKDAYRQDWGEQLVGKVQPVICVLDIESHNISVLEDVPAHLSPAQAIWTPDDAGVVFVGWWQDPYKLGLIFCTIRRSAIYHLDFQSGNCSIIGKDDQSVRTPRFSPDLQKLVYLENVATGPHTRAMKLMMFNWVTKKYSTIIDIVMKPTAESEFPGIYPVYVGLPKLCWASDSERVVFHSSWGSRKELVYVSVKSKVIKKISQKEYGSSELLAIQNDWMVVSCSSPNRPPILRLAKLLPAGGEGNINWFDLDPATLLDDLTWEVQVFQPKCVNPDYPDLHFEGILILPKPSETVKEGSKEGEAGKPPLIIFPHGGPHSIHLAGWNLYVAGFARLGFATMLVNYRGSTGFGDDGIFSLLGNCGKQDVADCQQCADELVASGVVDGNRVVCFGGSHGGFLVAHLIGRYPDFYKAAECRNPVINIATKLGGSDIPDWSYVEGGLGAFHFARVPTPADLEKMLNDSPIVLADKMKTPLLLMIGGADKRVPPHQGHELYKALKARHVPVKMYVMDDNHSLSKVDVDSNVFVHSIRWLLQHIGGAPTVKQMYVADDDHALSKVDLEADRFVRTSLWFLLYTESSSAAAAVTAPAAD